MEEGLATRVLNRQTYGAWPAHLGCEADRQMGSQMTSGRRGLVGGDEAICCSGVNV